MGLYEVGLHVCGYKRLILDEEGRLGLQAGSKGV